MPSAHAAVVGQFVYFAVYKQVFRLIVAAIDLAADLWLVFIHVQILSAVQLIHNTQKHIAVRRGRFFHLIGNIWRNVVKYSRLSMLKPERFCNAASRRYYSIAGSSGDISFDDAFGFGISLGTVEGEFHREIKRRCVIVAADHLLFDRQFAKGNVLKRYGCGGNSYRSYFCGCDFLVCAIHLE